MQDPSSQASNSSNCYFRVGSYGFAAEGRFVKQIIKLNRFSPVPRSSPYLWGLVALESSILPLINSYRLLELTTDQPNLAIVFSHDTRLMAFALDEVIGLGELEPSSTESLIQTPLPESLKTLVKGHFSFQNSLFHMLDIAKLLAHVEKHVEVV